MTSFPTKSESLDPKSESADSKLTSFVKRNLKSCHKSWKHNHPKSIIKTLFQIIKRKHISGQYLFLKGALFIIICPSLTKSQQFKTGYSMFKKININIWLTLIYDYNDNVLFKYRILFSKFLNSFRKNIQSIAMIDKTCIWLGI